MSKKKKIKKKDRIKVRIEVSDMFPHGIYVGKAGGKKWNEFWAKLFREQ